jgi:hypothetical protein
VGTYVVGRREGFHAAFQEPCSIQVRAHSSSAEDQMLVAGGVRLRPRDHDDDI